LERYQPDGKLTAALTAVVPGDVSTGLDERSPWEIVIEFGHDFIQDLDEQGLDTCGHGVITGGRRRSVAGRSTDLTELGMGGLMIEATQESTIQIPVRPLSRSSNPSRTAIEIPWRVIERTR
jgi:hypothetical protein